MTKAQVWILRAGVLGAFAATLWLAGPRAWRVVGGQLQKPVHASAAVELGRVGFLRKPEWAVGALFLSMLRDLQPRLEGRLDLLDNDAAQRLAEQLRASPWVAAVDLQRAFPDKLGLELSLRRPVLEVLAPDGGSAESLVDATGICLPWVAGTGLPVTERVVGTEAGRAGEPHPDEVVRAAAGVAAEWGTVIAPQVEGAPDLVLVDARNLHYRYTRDPYAAEVRVGLRRGDGETAFFAYGRPPGAVAPRVDAAVKVTVLRSILAEFPGLAGLQSGELRLINRWRTYLQPRPTN